MVREFFVRGNLLGILRVFKCYARDCISVFCKYIEDRLKKDGVLTVGKRRLFPKKRRVSGAKTSFFDPKYFVFFRKNAVFLVRGSFCLPRSVVLNENKPKTG